jgi:hypothetical protein
MDTNVFISNEQKKFYTNHFDTVDDGVYFSGDFLRTLYKVTLPELKKAGFTESELCLCIDVTNGTMLQGEFASEGLTLNVEDSIALDHTDVKWEIDREAFLKKLHSLSRAQNAVLSMWAKSFWVQNLREGDKDLEAYVAELAA